MINFKVVLVLFLLSSNVFITSGQYAWTQKASFAGTARYSAASFSIGGKAYVGTGWDGGLCQDFWEYDPAADTWTQKANFGGISRYAASGFAIGSKGYIGLGRTVYPGPGFAGDMWEYDPLLNTWVQKASFPGSARFTAVAFSIGANGYVGTGYNGTLFRDFWAYNPATNAWTQKADFGGTSRQSAAGFAINGKGYIGTGYDGFNRADFWEYDTTTNTWTQQADFGGLTRYGATAFEMNGSGYMGLGFNGSTLYHDFWKYDPGQNTWIQVASYPGSPAQSASAIACTVGGNAYVGLGSDNGTTLGTFTTDWWTFGPQASGLASHQSEDPFYRITTLFSNETALQLLQSGSTEWEVYTYSGQLIETGRSSKGIRSLGSSWEPGAYVIRLIHGSRQTSQWLMKTH